MNTRRSCHSLKKSIKQSKIELGVCYYPEHWSEELWEDDYKRMKELGFSIVRVGEFAWSIFEPNEGEFSFEFFDRAINLAAKCGLKVVLGTPTATPPAWLTFKYPEVLNVSMEGVQYQHGQRRHYNYNSAIYRELSARIVRKMVDHYKDHKAVIGWQIDNELNCETNVFYSDADHQAFRVWLQQKYGTLDHLNKAWGAVFWNQTYTEWEQVHLTRPTVSDSPNPHQALDEKRFISDSAISFAEIQANIMRELAPNQWVTTNGLFGHLDNHKMTDELLDFFAYDSYPNFSTIYPDKGDKPLLDRKWSWNLTGVRSISENFAVFEQQSGPGGWVNRMEQPSPKPGQMRLWTYQSIAHGADMVLYFRWRTANIGTEIYWHGINDYHNQPNRRVQEAARVGEEVAKIAERVVGSKYKAEVAILKDYDNEWDGELDHWHGPLEQRSILSWVKALQYNHIPMDAVYLNDKTTITDIQKYKVLIYPHATILTSETAALLSAYVENGGKVIFGCRTGYKNENGHCYMAPFPGPVSELCGITVEDFSLIGPFEEPPTFEWSHNGISSTFEGFIEILNVIGTNTIVLGRHKDGYNDAKPVLVKNRYGKGESYYFGSAFTLEIAEHLLELIGLKKSLEWISMGESVEVAKRVNEKGEQFIFLLNYSNTTQPVTLGQPCINLFNGSKVEGTVTLSPFDVLVLEEE